MRKVLICGVLALVGCSSQQALVARRDQVREANSYPEIADPAAYRSKDTVRGARWGMTVDEVVALRGEPAERHGDTLIFDEQLDGVTVGSAYVFANGQLAEIRTRWMRDEITYERLEAALSEAHGRPVQRYEQIEELTAMQRQVAATDVGLLFGSIALAAASKGPSYGGLGLVTLNHQSMQRALVDAQSRPYHEAGWFSKETQVHLLSADGQMSMVTWRSRGLGRALADKEFRELNLGLGNDPSQPVDDLAHQM